MNLLIDKSFDKDLKKIKDKSLKHRIANTIEEFLPISSLDELRQIKKLKGDNNSYRLKLGDYRIGFIVENDTVILVRILHRKDIYKYFPK